MRASRVEVAERLRETAGGARPDYGSSFAVVAGASHRRSPEQWAQAVFEDAPLGLRQVLVGGWLALGLRLAPRPSPDHVLGWRIASTTPDTIVLELDSKLMSAQNVIEVDGTRVVWTTLVHYRNRLGAVMWSAAAPVHHLILPRLLGRAAA